MKNRILLIDADVLVYVFASRNQKAIQFRVDGDGQEVTTKVGMCEKAFSEYKDFISSMVAELQATQAIMCLSHLEGNFRAGLLPSYKGNRAGKEKPLLYFQLREFIEANYPTTITPNIEADDQLGIWLTDGASHPSNDYICCTIDKDLKTISGLHYNWDRPEEGIVTITQDQANRNFLYQTLVGDSVDGFSGLKGCGPVAANRILDVIVPWDYEEAWEAVVTAYEKKGTVQDAILMARMARILTSIDMATEFWTPPGADTNGE